MGSLDWPFNPLSIAIGAEATFVARAIDTDRAHLTDVLRAAAESLFARQVIVPAADAPTALGRLRLLVERYLDYLEAETFPGGCFFASALCEMDMQPGLVRDRLVALHEDWRARLEGAVRDAQLEGAIDPAEDAAQLTFELEAVLLLANVQYVVARAAEPIERARRAVDHRLAPTVMAARE